MATWAIGNQRHGDRIGVAVKYHIGRSMEHQTYVVLLGTWENRVALLLSLRYIYCLKKNVEVRPPVDYEVPHHISSAYV